MTQFIGERTPAAFVPYESRQHIVCAGDSLTVGNQSVSTGGYKEWLLRSIGSSLYAGAYYPNVILTLS